MVKWLNERGAGKKLLIYTTLKCKWNIVSESKEDQLLIEDRMVDRLVGWERMSDGWPTGKQGEKRVTDVYLRVHDLGLGEMTEWEGRAVVSKIVFLNFWLELQVAPV